MRYRVRITRLLACTAIGVSSAALTARAAELLQPASIDNAAVYAAGVSADGSVVVGTLNPGQSWTRSGFVWTQAEGMQRVGGVSAGSMLEKRFTATGVLNDGTVIVGQASPDMLPGGSFTARAYRWTAADGFVDLGGLPGALAMSSANGVSGNGQVVVGETPDASGAMRGFRWTREGGMVNLGELPGMITLGAWASSYDGSVIVGNAAGDYGVGAQGFRWTQDGGIALLPTLNGGTQSVVRGISDDGRVIVGQAHNGASGKMHATRWVNTSPEDLTTPGSGLGDNYSFAFGISGNGKVVVGETQLDHTTTVRAFRWTEGDGMQTVEDWLRDSGAVIATDITYAARAANCDGSVVVGETAHYSSNQSRLFIARGNGTGSATCDGTADSGDPGDGDSGGGKTGGGNAGGGAQGGTGPAGLITLPDLEASLVGAAGANVSTLAGLGVQLNGAGSRPLDRRAAKGKPVFWITGDWGLDRHRGRNGDVKLGEIGGGYNFGPVQLNGVAGVTGIGQNTALGGRTDAVGGYVKLEALSRLHATERGGLWAIVTGTGLWGSADITRNYLINGGLIDSSRGLAPVAGYGLRGRLQWENALPYVSPYGDLSYSSACLGAYTEAGGAFPAAFNRLCDTATELRYGLDATVPLTERFRLTGTLEGVHRFEAQGNNVAGQVVGLGGFNFGAVRYQQDWLRAGLGFEADVGKATFSLMGNATTSGEGPTAWVTAALRIAF